MGWGSSGAFDDSHTGSSSSEIEESAGSVGPGLLRSHTYLAHRGRADVWRGASSFTGPCGGDPAGRDGGDDGDGGELWPHGNRLSLSRIGLHLCQSGVQPPDWICAGVGHVSRISFPALAKQPVRGANHPETAATYPFRVAVGGRRWIYDV